eukprot:CAMPEP_0170490620 /NCGR_PEP_ID=MMETSP0208-20121228/8767_1 /TAXON_ID=197538 /ORGANISM="Strombidium inclinatum, Strain S3" /LENGTH=336 /DNA_ID=CAMNT_0010766061 /DNA_START=763 /DNA_END=1769 /DNA_ORIENTATION=-
MGAFHEFEKVIAPISISEMKKSAKEEAAEQNFEDDMMVQLPDLTHQEVIDHLHHLRKMHGAGDSHQPSGGANSQSKKGKKAKKGRGKPLLRGLGGHHEEGDATDKFDSFDSYESGDNSQADRVGDSYDGGQSNDIKFSQLHSHSHAAHHQKKHPKRRHQNNEEASHSHKKKDSTVYDTMGYHSDSLGKMADHLAGHSADTIMNSADSYEDQKSEAAIDKVAHSQDFTGEEHPTPKCKPLPYPYGPANPPEKVRDLLTGKLVPYDGSAPEGGYSKYPYPVVTPSSWGTPLPNPCPVGTYPVYSGGAYPRKTILPPVLRGEVQLEPETPRLHQTQSQG